MERYTVDLVKKLPKLSPLVSTEQEEQLVDLLPIFKTIFDKYKGTTKRVAQNKVDMTKTPEQLGELTMITLRHLQDLFDEQKRI